METSETTCPHCGREFSPAGLPRHREFCRVMETRTREAGRTVLFLTVPSEMRIGAEPVTVLWPDGSAIEAQVFGADFSGPDAFLAERQAGAGLLEALRHLHTAVQGNHAGFVGEGELDSVMREAAAAIARATAPTPTPESHD
jgi:hypothetical protein